MVAYSYQKRFECRILDGSKTHTIRATGRRRHARPGDMIQHYVGMRTKQCRLIAQSRCTGAFSITLDLLKSVVEIRRSFTTDVIDTPDRLDAFARCDGFDDWKDMKAFWAKHHPGIDVFHGELICWRELHA